MKKLLSNLFMVILMILSNCILVFGDMVMYTQGSELYWLLSYFIVDAVYPIVVLVSVICLFLFIYNYLRNKELSDELKKEEAEKRLKKIEKLTFISLYILGLFSFFVICSYFLPELITDERIALGVSMGLCLVLFWASFFLLLVKKKKSKAFSIIYIPTLIVFFIYILYMVINIF